MPGTVQARAEVVTMGAQPWCLLSWAPPRPSGDSGPPPCAVTPTWLVTHTPVLCLRGAQERRQGRLGMVSALTHSPAFWENDPLAYGSPQGKGECRPSGLFQKHDCTPPASQSHSHPGEQYSQDSPSRCAEEDTEPECGGDSLGSHRACGAGLSLRPGRPVHGGTAASAGTC